MSSSGLLIPEIKNGSVSVNRPKFSPCATWNANATTFANSTTIGTNPGVVFVDRNNTIYITDRTSYRVQVWQNGQNNVTRTVSSGLNDPLGLFVLNNGDIYVDNGNVYNQINKWIMNSTNSTVVTYLSGGHCYGLFIDINQTLYCSLKINQVLKISLNSTGNMTQLAAGNSTPGNTTYLLNWPRGIFVDTNLDLYVADGGNNRIQKFSYGQLSGITIAGSGTTGTFDLNGPSDVVLDADGYLFIVDQNTNRVIGSGPYGYRCLVGCSQQIGSTSSQLNQPYSMSFDSQGNIYVTDKNNARVQMFNLATNPNSCNILSTQTPLLTSNNPSSSSILTSSKSSLLPSITSSLTISSTQLSSTTTTTTSTATSPTQTTSSWNQIMSNTTRFSALIVVTTAPPPTIRATTTLGPTRAPTRGTTAIPVTPARLIFLPNDPSRPVADIAAALGITADQLVTCFDGVIPATNGSIPAPAQLFTSKAKLFSCLQALKSTITIVELDKVMLTYRLK
ncbi:unnamed protein product [Adineta steineri]|uniref:NHL repeat containing protein n=1 Tax=Adineta steineri TaxID=433720 RepID=A0A819KBP7_9BILA|nr:unnamed protein product [Adineta steineri]